VIGVLVFPFSERIDLTIVGFVRAREPDLAGLGEQLHARWRIDAPRRVRSTRLACEPIAKPGQQEGIVLMAGRAEIRVTGPRDRGGSQGRRLDARAREYTEGALWEL